MKVPLLLSAAAPANNQNRFQAVSGKQLLSPENFLIFFF